MTIDATHARARRLLAELGDTRTLAPEIMAAVEALMQVDDAVRELLVSTDRMYRLSQRLLVAGIGLGLFNLLLIVGVLTR